MIGNGYWATGITVRYRTGGRWGCSLNYLDAGFCNDGPAGISTQGTLHTRYYVHESEHGFDVLTKVIDTLVEDARRLGITFRGVAGAPPSLYMEQDGEGVETPPDWPALLSRQAVRLGWEAPREYSDQPA